MIIRIFFLVGFIILYSDPVLAGACDTTISSATTSQLSCADNDSLTVDSSGSISYNNQNAVLSEKLDGVTINNSGTIKTTTDGDNGDSAIPDKAISSTKSITRSGLESVSSG